MLEAGYCEQVVVLLFEPLALEFLPLGVVVSDHFLQVYDSLVKRIEGSENILSLDQLADLPGKGILQCFALLQP